MNKYLKENGGSLHASEMKAVLAVNGRNGKPITLEPDDSWSQMIITTAEKLSPGIPVQIQFEIIPEEPIGYTKRVVKWGNGTELIYCVLSPQDVVSGDCVARTYTAAITSVKARVKPGSAQFVGAEEKYLNDIINGMRIKKRAEKLEEANRFTGLELS